MTHVKRNQNWKRFSQPYTNYLEFSGSMDLWIAFRLQFPCSNADISPKFLRIFLWLEALANVRTFLGISATAPGPLGQTFEHRCHKRRSYSIWKIWITFFFLIHTCENWKGDCSYYRNCRCVLFYVRVVAKVRIFLGMSVGKKEEKRRWLSWERDIPETFRTI